jgi:hypothetical protein
MNKQFVEDLIKAQNEIKPIKKTGHNPHFKSEYAEYDHVIEECKRVCHKYNMFITHRVSTQIENKTELVTEIHHAPTGEILDSSMPLINKAQTDQGMGSSITYAKRYTISSLLAVATQEDDDAEKAEDRGVKNLQENLATPSKNHQQKASQTLEEVQHKHIFKISKYNTSIEYCTVKLPNGEYCKEQIINP